MTTDEQSPVRVERRGPILVITLDRPQARNAVNQAVSQAVAAAIDLLETDPDLYVGIVTGAGGYFSAGMDLKAFLRGESPRIEGRGFAGLTEAPPGKPLIAAVDGPALAGGFEMALAADLIVASSNAVFGLPEVRRGLAAAAGGLTRLPARVPRAVALELVLTGRNATATELHHHGLVNRVVPDGQALDAALELATEIAANGPLAVRASKRVVDESASWAPDQAFARAREIVMPIFATNDAREGATAFAERRTPVWTAS
ncbi:crotonase/enoyl-CoA hydratase family protein [Prescottella sp. R16]|uniref:crotonase/enoyl-CoA hydratase family protein n=1 Tax=Prescottella sp. R16 TaxID=3064529 RepID=UPI00272E4F7C|nr:crotonase/enoyl-CoA hydratase family protein [Prescottella sp. R16]